MTRGAGPIRLLVVARHPLRLEDLGLADLEDVEAAQLIRRPAALELAIDELGPNVALIDVAYPEGDGFKAIGETRALAPEVQVLALTPDPPPHDDVAKATRAGASGFIDTNADPEEFVEALRTVRAGKPWLPPEQTRAILSSVAEDLDVTAAERRSRLTSIVIGLIPLAGVLAAIMSLLWRSYLGHIGVRPVDLAIDPTTRVVDVIFFLTLLLGVIGPLLFVGSWLDLLRDSAADWKGTAWFYKRPTAARLIMSLGILAVTGFLAVFADLVLLVFVGPIVAISMLAQSLGLSDEVPTLIRITRVRPVQVLTGGLLVLVVFMTILSTEVLVLGPAFGPNGASGVLAPRILGFVPQPMLAFDVDGAREPREILYLGGNADLYVLVDPCDDDTVEYVSVGSTRLVVIDEVTCASPGGDP